MVPAKLQARVTISARSGSVLDGVGRSSLRCSARSSASVLPVLRRPRIEVLQATSFSPRTSDAGSCPHDAAGHKPAEEHLHHSYVMTTRGDRYRLMRERGSVCRKRQVLEQSVPAPA
jgi:hypothetical protein